MNTPLRRSGMAHVLKGSDSFTCTPRIHLLTEWTIPAFAFPAEAGTYLPSPEGWKAELALALACHIVQILLLRVRIDYTSCDITPMNLFSCKAMLFFYFWRIVRKYFSCISVSCVLLRRVTYRQQLVLLHVLMLLKQMPDFESMLSELVFRLLHYWFVIRS